MWLWNHDSKLIKWQYPVMWYAALGRHATEFARWQHPAMWQVALGWHAIEFAQTSPILEFYIWFQFRRYHCNRHVILHHSVKFYPNRTTHGRKMTSCWFSRCQISAIVNFNGPIIDSLKSPCTTSYRSSIETTALNCLVFEKIALCILATDRQTDRQTNRWTGPSCQAALAVASDCL